MKKLIVIFILTLAFTPLSWGQQRVIEKQFQFNENQEIELDLKFGETIHIKAWDKDEVAFKANININNGKLNDALKLTFDEESGRLHITSDYDKDKLKAGRREDCPDSPYSTFSWNGDSRHVVCSQISYELYVPADAKLDIESISSNIELVDVEGPIRAKSISGFVDLSWPQGKSATIDLKTVSGEAYTDIDNLKFTNKKDHTPLVGYKINGEIAGGGTRVSLESVSGNIYLRKAQS